MGGFGYIQDKSIKPSEEAMEIMMQGYMMHVTGVCETFNTTPSIMDDISTNDIE